MFHAGTKSAAEGVVTSGGRVLGVTALGGTVKEAIDRAYSGVKLIAWPGMHFRKDIGAKAMNR